jgi:hypothetical protein
VTERRFGRDAQVGYRDVQCGAAALRALNLHVPAEGFYPVDQPDRPDLLLLSAPPTPSISMPEACACRVAFVRA